ncbi:MAG: ABC transporter permease [Halanaerobiales bacterium]
MKMFKAMFMANVKEYIRDRSALFWFLVFPLIFVFIFGWVFSGTGSSPTFNIGVIVHSENIMSDRMIEGFKSVESFNTFVQEGSGGDGELEELRRGNRSVVIEIPEVSITAMTGQEAIDIPVYYDASKQQTSQVLLSVVRQFFTEAERQMTDVPRIFNLEEQSITSESMTDFAFVLPGILAMALMQLGLFGSLQFLTLREKNIVRGLGVTPLNRTTLLSSEILLRMILGLIQTTIILTIGYFVFDISIISSIFKVFGVVMLGSITFISLGYMLISFVRTEEGGNGLIQVVQFPMMFLSGIFFPHEMMPDFMQPVVRILPLTYLGDALRGVIAGLPTLYPLMTNLLVLTGWLLVTMVITIKFWRWD